MMTNLSKLKRLHYNRRRKAEAEARRAADAFLLASVLRQHYPLTAERWREIAGLSATRFRQAKPKVEYWRVGKEYEPVTNTARL